MKPSCSSCARRAETAAPNRPGVPVTGIYDRRQRRFVDMPRMMQSIGAEDVPSPALGAAAAALLAADTALKQDDD